MNLEAIICRSVICYIVHCDIYLIVKATLCIVTSHSCCPDLTNSYSIKVREKICYLTSTPVVLITLCLLCAGVNIKSVIDRDIA